MAAKKNDASDNIPMPPVRGGPEFSKRRVMSTGQFRHFAGNESEGAVADIERAEGEAVGGKIFHHHAPLSDKSKQCRR